MLRLLRALPVIGALMIAAGAVQGAPKVGAKPADVTVMDLSGKAVKLSKLRAGKPVLVNFWASW